MFAVCSLKFIAEVAGAAYVLGMLTVPVVVYIAMRVAAKGDE